MSDELRTVKLSQLLGSDRYKGMTRDTLTPTMIQTLLAANSDFHLTVHRSGHWMHGSMTPKTAHALELRGLMENHMHNGEFGMWIITKRGREVVAALVQDDPAATPEEGKADE